MRALTPASEADALEQAMRAILRMFADGNLIYRRREHVDCRPITLIVERLKGWRRRP